MRKWIAGLLAVWLCITASAVCTATAEAEYVGVEMVIVMVDGAGGFNMKSLTEGQRLAVDVRVLPSNATNKDVEWTTSDSGVAYVENGEIVAVSAGYATLTCTAVDNGCYDDFSIFVLPAVESIQLSQSDLVLMPGASAKLEAYVQPYNAARTVGWSSSDESVAAVSEGSVTAVGKGTAEIICSATDGSGVQARCAVTVTDVSYGSSYCWNCGEEQPMGAVWDASRHQIFCMACGTNLDSGRHAASCLDVYSCFGCGYESETAMKVLRSSHTGDVSYIIRSGCHDYVCGDCGETFYSSTHWGSCADGLCEECGGEITSPAQLDHDYDYSTYCCDPEFPDQHYSPCTRCDARSYEKHSGNSEGVCNNCGAAYDGCMHDGLSYRYIPDPDNAERHMRICTENDCGKILGYSEHANYCYTGDDLCDDCGAECAVTHMSLNSNYAEPDPDNPNLHYYRCWDCDEILLTEAHWIECSDSFDVCGGCGVVLGEDAEFAVKHDYAYEDAYMGQHCVPNSEDADLHDVICGNCGESVRSEPHYIPDAHLYGEKYCLCGAYVGEYDCSIRNHTLNSIDEDFHIEELWEGLYPDPADPTQHYTICSCGEKITEKHVAYCYNQGKCLRCLVEFDGPYLHKYSGGACVWCGETEAEPIEIVLSAGFVELAAGMTETLTALPEEQVFVWTSSSPDVVSVEDGVLTANRSGVAMIVCTLAADESVYAQCGVAVLGGEPLEMPEELVRIEDEAFAGVSAGTALLPEGTQTIGARAFADCEQLGVVVMPDSVTEIADDAFEGCGRVGFLCESENSAAAYAQAHGIPYLIR